jgi:superfamily II DNA or RNA helicase
MERGVYETLITQAIEREIKSLAPNLIATTEPLALNEASTRIAQAIEFATIRTIESLPEQDRSSAGIAIAASVHDVLAKYSDTPAIQNLLIPQPASMLKAIQERLAGYHSSVMLSPLIPLNRSELLVNAQGELRVSQALQSEISSVDSIDLIIAFVRTSGIRPFLPALRDAVARGVQVRLITTTYTGSTEPSALELLRSIGCKIKVSYDTGTTRLHAKSWIFHRNTGFSTAYIGSSNLSYSAMQAGLEWNIRISTQSNPLVLDKMKVLFETYWNDPEFETYDARKFALEVMRTKPAPLPYQLPNIELRLEQFQERLLEQIALARSRDLHRNLLVSATGTGKTVMAAIDYVRLSKSMPRANLLFIAHREEIIDQSLATFRFAMKDSNFGEKLVSGHKPIKGTHVFASIQSLHERTISGISRDNFDMIIIDEFHHAAAPSYQRVLEYFQPKEWLGLTATPERSDGLPIIELFGGKIAAELRLWDAIDQGRLVPFTYFGVSDGIDLSAITWKRGVGYDVSELTQIYAANPGWIDTVIESIDKYIGLATDYKALGFCVSVIHAEFMAGEFIRRGIPATFVSGESDEATRRDALQDLKDGRIKVVFSVDLFNEGIDVPEVDVLLMMRPTDSPVLFLQQLGRGLRKLGGKYSCTIIDFVSNHRKEFRFDRKLGALLPGNRKSLIEQIERSFPTLPVGCHMEFDRISSEIVIESIRNALPTTWKPKVEACRRFFAAGGKPSLQEFLLAEGLEIEAIYEGGRCWTELISDAGFGSKQTESIHLKGLRRALNRLLHIDDPERIEALQLLAKRTPLKTLSARQTATMELIVCNLVNQLSSEATLEVSTAYEVILSHPELLLEIGEIADILENRQSHLTIEVDPVLPLRLNARYTRVEIFAAYGYKTGAKVAPWQSGVWKVPQWKSDLLAITLDKSADSFTERTSYKDYALSPKRFHWESQTDTSADSATGQRYIHHSSQDWKIQLFVRKSNEDRAFWYIGSAQYVEHRGSNPMEITWDLDHGLPGDLYQDFAAAVA